MRRKSTLKVARGRLEEDRRKSDDRFEYQRVMLFMLPLLMIAVLVVGVYFGYLSFSDNFVQYDSEETRAVGVQPEFTEDESRCLLTVVSSANPVEASFVPELTTVKGLEVSTLMAPDLELLLADAEALGLNLKLVSGYISYEEQKQKYDEAVKKYKKENKSTTVKAEVAVKKTIPNAGESEQQTGLIVQFSSGADEKFDSTAEFRWLEKNCVNYGFILRYPEKENTGGLSYSPSLFRYVGYENALSMRSYNMNLDEYVQYLEAQ